MAQLDNAADSDSEERGFESLRAGHEKRVFCLPDKRLFFRTKCALRHDKHTFGALSDALHREVPAGVSGTLNFTSCASTILHSGIAAVSLGEAKLH